MKLFFFIVVKLKPRPWLRPWEQMQNYVHGYELTDVSSSSTLSYIQNPVFFEAKLTMTLIPGLDDPG